MIHASSDRLLEVLSSSSGPARRARIEENQQGLETRKYLTCREARMWKQFCYLLLPGFHQVETCENITSILKKGFKEFFFNFFIGGTDVFKIGNWDAVELTHLPQSLTCLQRQFYSRSRTSYASKMNLLNFLSKSFRVIPWLYFLFYKNNYFQILIWLRIPSLTL